MLIMVVVFSSCVKNKTGQKDQSQSGSEGNSFEVVEVVQGNTYTYMNVKEGNGEKWMAISKQEINPGDVYYYGEGLPMTNFHSKEIDRTFETIYFVSNISTTPIESSGTMDGMGAMGSMGAMGGSGHDQGHSGKVSSEQNSKIEMKKSAGELTVGEVFANRDSYSEKEVEIRGVVVKVNKEVMGKNWIHIQDGTQDNGEFDLTVTSLDLPEVNDEIIVKGKIILNKDFGYGYSYDVIMEEAKIVKTKPAGSTM